MGRLNSPATYVARMTRNDLAGDVCTCRDSSHDDCIVAPAAGVDCSGFVSRAWGLTEKEGTSSLPNISTVISNWQNKVSQVKPGDALNRSGSHVRLALDATSDPEVKVVVIELTTARTCKRRNGTQAVCEGVCECMRPISDFNGYRLLRFSGIKD